MEKYVIVIEFVSNEKLQAYDIYDRCKWAACDRVGPERGVASLFKRRQIKLEKDVVEKDTLIKADELGH